METLDTRIGLANIGNTCFMNVILQILRLCPAITELFLREDVPFRATSKKKEFYTGIQTLIRDFWRNPPGADDNPVLIPRAFFQSLHRTLRECDDDWYHPGQQCDSAEALQYLLESLHDAIYHPVTMKVRGAARSSDEVSQMKALDSWIAFYGKEYSPIITNFYGQTQIRIVCSQCKNVSERYEPWMVLKAPIPGSERAGGPAPTLDTCIRAAFAEETIDDYHCDTCKAKTRATINTRVSRFPPFLCLSLKRFTNAGQKVRGLIAWDVEHTAFTSVAAFNRDPFGEDFHTDYMTVAVVEHWGSVHGGHYRMYNRQGSKWYNYDDNSVTEVPPDSIVNEDSYIAVMIPRKKAASLYSIQKKTIESWRATQIAPPA